MKWVAVVTTAPRQEPTLVKTLISLDSCGWKPVIFAEPLSPITDWTKNNFEVYHNTTRLGVWFNWLKSAEYALKQKPDLIAMFQDDVEVHPESKDFIENLQWPKDAGYISLYTPKHYQLTKSGICKHGMFSVKTGAMWGATALIFKPDVLKATIEHRKAKEWCGIKPRTNPEGYKERRRAQPWTIQNSDYIIGLIVQNYLRKKLYYFSPSLCSHIAEHSAIGHGGNKGRRNCYVSANYALPVKEQVFGTLFNPRKYDRLDDGNATRT
jgi:hypothetical protein